MSCESSKNQTLKNQTAFLLVYIVDSLKDHIEVSFRLVLKIAMRFLNIRFFRLSLFFVSC